MATENSSIGRLILKLAFKFILPLVIILSFIPGPNGKPIMDWSAWLPNKQLMTDAKKMLGQAPIKDNPFKTEKTVYKWKDEHGNWQFSQTPPKNLATKSEKFSVSSKVNTMSAPPAVETDSSSGGGSDQSDTVKMHEIDKPSFPSPTTISPADIPKLIENVKNVQKIMDQRGEKLEDE